MIKETRYIAFRASMLTTTVLMSVGQLIFMWLFKQRTGTDFVVALYQLLYNNFMAVIPTGLSGENVTVYKEFVELTLTSFINLVPAIIIIFSMILGYGSYLVSKLIATITRRNADMYLRFSDIRATKFVAKGFAIFFLLSVFVDNSTIGHCIMNIVSIFSFILTIAGITFILRKMKEKNITLILRLLAGVGIFFSLALPLASYFYIGTGLFDAFRDNRPSSDGDNGGIDNE